MTTESTSRSILETWAWLYPCTMLATANLDQQSVSNPTIANPFAQNFCWYFALSVLNIEHVGSNLSDAKVLVQCHRADWFPENTSKIEVGCCSSQKPFKSNKNCFHFFDICLLNIAFIKNALLQWHCPRTCLIFALAWEGHLCTNSWDMLARGNIKQDKHQYGAGWCQSRS